MAASVDRVLVVEGGGMRGSYAAGALLQLYESGDRNYDAVYATSSGAACSAYNLTGQSEAVAIWKDHLHGSQFISIPRMLRGGAALDLDYLVDHLFQRKFPLNVERLRSRGIPLQIPVTDVLTGEVRYFDATKRDPFPLLRAAMSVPGAAIHPVMLDGRAYVDGGVVDQVPLLPALALRPREVTVVLTRPQSYASRPLGRLDMWLAARHFPGIRKVLAQRHERHEATMRALRTTDAKVRIIQPKGSIPVERWTTARSKLHAAIDAGRRDAARALAPPRVLRRRSARSRSTAA